MAYCLRTHSNMVMFASQAILTNSCNLQTDCRHLSKLLIKNCTSTKISSRCVTRKQLVWCHKENSAGRSRHFPVTAYKPKEFVKLLNSSGSVSLEENLVRAEAAEVRSLPQSSFLRFCYSDFERETLLLGSAVEPPPMQLKVDRNAVRREEGKPSNEQLENIFTTLSTNLPELFVKSLDYTIYRPDLVLENNIRGKRTIGLYHYIKEIALLRAIGHLKYAYIKFDIIKITRHPEDGTVKVRWRIRGVSGLRVMVMFWKFKLWKGVKELFSDQESWYDGFSTFFVGSDGKVYKLITDKMVPENNEEVLGKESRELGAKLALMLGLVIIPKAESVVLSTFSLPTTSPNHDIQINVDKKKLKPSSISTHPYLQDVISLERFN